MSGCSLMQNNNLDSICLIWLDASVNNDKENTDAQQDLRLIINQLKTFTEVQPCEQYICQTSRDDRIFLIANGRFGQEIIPRIHAYRQVCSIYVYCMDKKRNEEWSKQFKKVKSVVTTLDELVSQIQLDLRKRIENKIDEPFRINLSKSNCLTEKSTMELNGEFFYAQLLIDCLLRMNTNGNEKSELINFCENIYQSNPNELKVIKEFEQNYLSHRAIWWYTRESCFYRLLNKALRIQNIDLLFLFRFFIRDLDNQLRQFQYSSSVRVYRGQLMSNEELNQLQKSIGEYISIHSFLSTSLDRSIAMKFLQDYSSTNDLQKILFEIDANPVSDQQKSFSHVKSSSYYSNEQEVLFMLGSIFRLSHIHQDTGGIWIIRMSLSTTNDHDFKVFFEHMKKEYSGVNEETTLISLGNILYQMGKYDLAEKYYHRLLKDLPPNHVDLSRCYHALGMISLMKQNYAVSLQWHEKSLACLKSTDPRIAECYNCIGCVYQKIADHPRAIEFYTKAVNIWTTMYGDDYYQIADCLNNIGCVYETDQNYSKALEFHEKALAIREKTSTNDHRDLGASYNNIGNIHLCLQQYDLALQNYQTALQIKTETLPGQHASLASTLENIGLVYERTEQFQQALIYYRKAANIFREVFASNHIHVIDINEDIERISDVLKSNS